VRTRLVLFDIDGTLIRTGGAGVRAFAQAAEFMFGRPGGTHRLQFQGRTDVSLVREFFRINELPDSPEQVIRFLDTYVHFLDDQLHRQRGEICPGVRELLEALRRIPEGPAVGLLTGNIRLGARLKLEAHGLAEAFDLGAYGDDHESRNQLARIALERGSLHLGRPLSGREVVVIGDTQADIECARAIRARCVAVATGGVPLSELLKHSPALAVESLAEVTAARVLSVGDQIERSTDWDALYQVGDTRWDKGEPAPGLVDFLAGRPNLVGRRILVPGCGRGHDARAWAGAGCNVIGIDLSPRALREARERVDGAQKLTFQEADFLEKPSQLGQFDWIFEHTLWCAIPPGRRGDYVRSVKAALAPGGHYLSINYLQPADEEGPPFGVTLEELRGWFEEEFELVIHWLPRSFPGRAGRERMFLWNRRS